MSRKEVEKFQHAMGRKVSKEAKGLGSVVALSISLVEFSYHL